MRRTIEIGTKARIRWCKRAKVNGTGKRLARHVCAPCI